MAKAKGIAGSALVVAGAGLYLVYAGVKDVQLIPGLRDLLRGKAPTGKPHAPFTPAQSSGVTTGGSFIPSGGPVSLVTVNGIRVNTSIAANLSRMITAAKLDGITLTGGGYRSSLEQANLRRQHCCNDPNSSVCSCGPNTAPVGQSRHEQGLAIDFTNSGGSIDRGDKEYVWLTQHAAAYGFYNLPSEPWHWSVDGK